MTECNHSWRAIPNTNDYECDSCGDRKLDSGALVSEWADEPAADRGLAPRALQCEVCGIVRPTSEIGPPAPDGAACCVACQPEEVRAMTLSEMRLCAHCGRTVEPDSNDWGHVAAALPESHPDAVEFWTNPCASPEPREEWRP